MTDHSTEGLLRELLTGQAVIATKVQALEKMPAQLESLRAEVTSVDTQRRQDLNNSYERLLTKIADHDKADGERFEAIGKLRTDDLRRAEEHREADLRRVDALERIRDQNEGARGLAGFVAKHAPLLLSVAAAFMAAVGLKDRLP